jgi:hypothetical protein
MPGVELPNRESDGKEIVTLHSIVRGMAKSHPSFLLRISGVPGILKNFYNFG